MEGYRKVAFTVLGIAVYYSFVIMGQMTAEQAAPWIWGLLAVYTGANVVEKLRGFGNCGGEKK
jgi:type IV secretory pathway VirB2 component (pilin)